MQKEIVNFLKQHVYFILGGACILVVGLMYLVGRGSDLGVDHGEAVLIIGSGSSEAVSDPGHSIIDDYSEPAFEPALTDHEDDPQPEVARKVVVHIVGAVVNPGVYEVYEGSRVNDVLIMAGGGTSDADLSRINLAAVTVDAMQIIVPEIGQDIEDVFVYPSSASVPGGNRQESSAQNQSGGLININTATLQELQTLPGVGPVLAQNIVSFRETHGRFSTVDELIHVSRIGEATLERLRPFVTVG